MICFVLNVAAYLFTCTQYIKMWLNKFLIRIAMQIFVTKDILTSLFVIKSYI